MKRISIILLSLGFAALTVVSVGCRTSRNPLSTATALGPAGNLPTGPGESQPNEPDLSAYMPKDDEDSIPTPQYREVSSNPRGSFTSGYSTPSPGRSSGCTSGCCP